MNIEILIDSADWTDSEARKTAELLLQESLDNLSGDDYDAIAGFLYAERASGGDFDFSNENTGNKYADRMAALLHSLEREAFNEATKNWVNSPQEGHNLICYVSLN